MRSNHHKITVSRFGIRKKLKSFLIKLFKKQSIDERGETEKPRLQSDLSAYEKLANWCREQKYESADTPNLSELFIRITIRNAKDEMLKAGWPEEKINGLTISSIYPIVSQYQTNILNELEINGNALIENRSPLTYDEIIFTELDINRDQADEKLCSRWHEYFDLSLADIWNQQTETDN